MKSEEKVKCHFCGRVQLFPEEGRVADGSWAEDERLPEDAKGKWFCCYSCYQKTLKGEKSC